MNNSDMPANPTKHDSEHFVHSHTYTTGLTKREAFAVAAMQGILANSEPNSWSEEQWYKQFSTQAVNHADALLKELAK